MRSAVMTAFVCGLLLLVAPARAVSTRENGSDAIESERFRVESIDSAAGVVRLAPLPIPFHPGTEFVDGFTGRTFDRSTLGRDGVERVSLAVHWPTEGEPVVDRVRRNPTPFDNLPHEAPPMWASVRGIRTLPDGTEALELAGQDWIVRPDVPVRGASRSAMTWQALEPGDTVTLELAFVDGSPVISGFQLVSRNATTPHSSDVDPADARPARREVR